VAAELGESLKKSENVVLAQACVLRARSNEFFCILSIFDPSREESRKSTSEIYSAVRIGVGPRCVVDREWGILLHAIAMTCSRKRDFAVPYLQNLGDCR
jgi:hypothetical protein